MLVTDQHKFQAIISHAKEYGFVFPSSEIYDGLSAVYDYGPWGSELKRNIRDAWWNEMTRMHDNIVWIDPMIDNKDSKKRYRVDHLIEGFADELAKDGKAEQAEQILSETDKRLAANDFAGLKLLIEEFAIPCPISGTVNWTDVRQFNLMFSTQLGSLAEESDQIFLRPETAQGMFVNFLNVQKTARMKVPFGIAQVGKAFRNEIVARQFIFRMREFEQMEMQFFIRPGSQKEWYEYWKAQRMNWHLSLGFPKEMFRFHDHTKLAHYADAAVDIVVKNFSISIRRSIRIMSRMSLKLQ